MTGADGQAVTQQNPMNGRKNFSQKKGLVS